MTDDELMNAFYVRRFYLNLCAPIVSGRLRGLAVERQSLAGELSLSCARLVDDG